MANVADQLDQAAGAIQRIACKAMAVTHEAGAVVRLEPVGHRNGIQAVRRSLRSVGNQHISFSATIPLPRKEKPPRRLRPMPLEAMRTNVREFLTLYATTGPTKWNYARWPGRIVSVSTIEKRFGSWTVAVAQARVSK